jgi:predicted RNA-binding protein (virulence factor B family)
VSLAPVASDFRSRASTPTLDDLLGYTSTLVLQRFAAPGAYLGLKGFEQPSILLPRSELDEHMQEGDALEAFVYLDSEDRPVATLKRPLLERDQVTFLEVKDVNRFGAFVDLGLPKQLLVPFAEQTRDLRTGDLEPIGLGLDRSGRLAGTMRIRELLEEGGEFTRNEWVEGEAWRLEPEIGLFVILERRHVGLLPAGEHHRLQRGERTKFRVAHVQPDGKLELSLRGLGHEELASDAERILRKLQQPNPPRVSDHSSPEELRAHFGLSRKAFKRAVGRLLKEGQVAFDEHGYFVAR